MTKLSRTTGRTRVRRRQGCSIASPDFAGKWLELILDITPGARRLAFLADASTKPSMLVYEKLRQLGAGKNATIHLLDARSRTDLEHSFEAIRKERIQGIIVGMSANVLENRVVHRILKGARPADLPVEQTSSVRTVLNLKTAHAMEITIPASVRLRADEVVR